MVFEKEDRVIGISHVAVEMTFVFLYLAFLIAYVITKISIFSHIGSFFATTNVLYIAFYGISCNRVMRNTDIFKNAISRIHNEKSITVDPIGVLKYHTDIQNEIGDTFFRLVVNNRAYNDCLRRVYLYMNEHSCDEGCTGNFLSLIARIVHDNKKEFRKIYEKFLFKEYKNYLPRYGGYKLEAYTKVSIEYPASLFELICHCVITNKFFEEIDNANKSIFKRCIMTKQLDLMSPGIIYDEMISRKIIDAIDKGEYNEK